MTEQPASTPRARTFVLRVVLDEQARLYGQASEPGSPDEWRVTVSSIAELWDRLERRLAEPTMVDPVNLGDNSA